MRFHWTALLTVTLALAAAVLPATPQATGGRNSRLAQTAFQLSVTARLAERKSQCMRAIGSNAFCDCLNGALPLDANFQRYVAVTTAPASGSAADDQRMVQPIRLARDSCVATVFPETK
jgi:hypothetical protein